VDALPYAAAGDNALHLLSQRCDDQDTHSREDESKLWMRTRTGSFLLAPMSSSSCPVGPTTAVYSGIDPSDGRNTGTRRIWAAGTAEAQKEWIARPESMLLKDHGCKHCALATSDAILRASGSAMSLTTGGMNGGKENCCASPFATAAASTRRCDLLLVCSATFAAVGNLGTTGRRLLCGRQDP
jgi:hypothetical protein